MKPRFMAPTSTSTSRSQESMDSSIRKRNRFPFGMPGQDFHVFPFLEFMQKQFRFARCCQLPGVGFLITRLNECVVPQPAPCLAPFIWHSCCNNSATEEANSSFYCRADSNSFELFCWLRSLPHLPSPRTLDAECQKLETHIRNFTIAGKLLLVCKYTVPNREEGGQVMPREHQLKRS